MKILHITPGSGGSFYCENCIRDCALVKALRARGHDAIMVPMYLPVSADEPVETPSPVFFGGINVYLQQQFRFFRKTPRWIDRLFDSRWMLKLAGKQAGSVRASGLGDMTLSMIRGRDGNQRKELDRLLQWLKAEPLPDVIHISNALLIGLAAALRQELGVPILCSLQDEDSWLDAMEVGDRDACWSAIRERTGDVDQFVAVSHYFAGVMAERLGIDRERIAVVHIGSEADGHAAAPLSMDPPTIGFLSRMSPALGLDRLVEAFVQLKQDPALSALRLRITGGQTGDDRTFLATLQEDLARRGFDRDVDVLPDFGREARLAFLSSLSVMCVPIPGGEAFGTFAVEAMASGVPLVEPRAGAFPELIESSGCGVLYDPGNPTALVDALRSVLTDVARARELGERGRAAFAEHFTIDGMASRTLEIYQAARRA